MWMLVMFDLPVKTKNDKREYRLFRGFLLDDGFGQLQYSVYGRHCASREVSETHGKRVHRAIPPRGEVRILRVTEAQFARMEIVRNYAPRPPEPTPLPLEFW